MKKALLSFVAALALVFPRLNAAELTIESQALGAGEMGYLIVGMNNTETSLSGFQFKLYLPEGLALTKNVKGKFVYTLGERIEYHTLSITALDDGGYQFIGYSMDADVITGNNGMLLSISLTAANSFVGPGNGMLTGIYVTDITSQTSSCSNVNFIIEGTGIPKCDTPTIVFDKGKVSFCSTTEGVEFVSSICFANGNLHHVNEINLTTIYRISVYAKKEGYIDSNVATADIDFSQLKGDVNNDGNITITDAVGIVNIILGNSGSNNQTEHDYVDLGLPSGTLWATCNIGASSPEDYGDYFAWGESEESYKSGKMDFSWNTYMWCSGSGSTMTKYCDNSSYGFEGFTDELTELEQEDDAAYANWGPGWRMPSIDQFRELINSNYTTTEWTTQNGVYGRKITSKKEGYTDRSIFLPAAGYRYFSSLDDAGSDGNYWSRTLYESFPYSAWHLDFYSSSIDTSYYNRCYGRSVRPVRVSE